MKITDCNIYLHSRYKKYKAQVYPFPSFGINLKNSILKDVFLRQTSGAKKSLSRIKNIHPGEYGTECTGSLPLENFEEQFGLKELKNIYKKGFSTNTEGWANCFLKSDAQKPLSTSSVYDCSVLYLFNEKTNTHFLYHAYFNTDKNLFDFLIKTFMPEGFSKACIVPGDANWSASHSETLPEMFAALKCNNKNAQINVFHYSSKLPEIVGHKGKVFEILNNRTCIGLGDKGQASFKICDLRYDDIFGAIDYKAVSSKKIALFRQFFAEQKYDNEVLKILNTLLDKRQAVISKIEACTTIEKLDSFLKSFNYTERLKYCNAIELQNQKILSTQNL